MNTDLQVRLCKALRDKNISDVVELIKAGATPNWHPGGVDTFSPIEEAAASNFLPGLEALLDAGGDVNFHGASSPLRVAAPLNCIEAGRWLLQHGADEQKDSIFARAPLKAALVKGNIKFIEMMLQERPKLLAKGFIEAAEYAMGWRQIATTEWLLQQGIDANFVNSKGRSWLMISQETTLENLEREAAPVTARLIHAGADVNFQGEKGLTALHMAVESNELQSFMMLLHAGADPGLKNHSGETVRDLLQADTYHRKQMRTAFEAWEASVKAHQMINDASLAPNLKSL